MAKPQNGAAAELCRNWNPQPGSALDAAPRWRGKQNWNASLACRVVRFRTFFATLTRAAPLVRALPRSRLGPSVRLEIQRMPRG